MAKKRPFAIFYAEAVQDHLQAIDAKYYSVIRATIESQLLHEPTVETRNRKPLKRPIVFGADWELRFGPDNRFRVFYQVDGENRDVHILAIGMKEGSRLYFGDEELVE